MVFLFFAVPVSAQSTGAEAEPLASTGIELDGKFHIVTQKEIDAASQLLHAIFRTHFDDRGLEVEILNQPNQPTIIGNSTNVYDEPERYILIAFNIWNKDGISVPCRAGEPPRPKTKPCFYKKVLSDAETAVTKN